MQRLRISLSFIVLVLAACAGTPGPGDPGYAFNVVGPYSGRFLIDNQPFDATLQLQTSSGGRVRGTFRVVSPIEIDGRVEGVIVDGLLRLTVTYRNAEGCDGRIEGILTVERGGGSFDGPVTVTDCGDPIAGQMSFRRTDRFPRGQAVAPPG